MSVVTVLAAESSDLSVWEQLLEVIVVGSIAGVGLSVAFSFLVRGVTQASLARREGQGGILPNLALAAVSGAICVAAVVFAVYEMITG